MAAKQVTERGLVMIDLASALLCCLSLSALLSSAEKLESSLTILKEVNLRGPYLGLITVYPPEEDAFFDTGAFKPHQKHPYVDLSGKVRPYITLIIEEEVLVSTILLQAGASE